MHGKSNLFPDDVGSQIIDKFSKGRQLMRTWFGLFKVTHQTNAYAHFVNILTMNMPAFQLLQPSRTDLNFAVPGINPVANYKMISQAIFHAARAMCPVVYCR